MTTTMKTAPFTIGQRVRVIGAGKPGTIAGPLTRCVRFGDKEVPNEVWPVMLDDGFWSEDRKHYVTLILVHAQNLEIV